MSNKILEDAQKLIVQIYNRLLGYCKSLCRQRLGEERSAPKHDPVSNKELLRKKVNSPRKAKKRSYPIKGDIGS